MGVDNGAGEGVLRKVPTSEYRRGCVGVLNTTSLTVVDAKDADAVVAYVM